MYPNGCKSTSTSGSLKLYKGSTLVSSVSMNDDLGYGFLYFNPLSAGTYTISFTPTWKSGDVKDYTI